MIRTLDEFYVALEGITDGIGEVCSRCDYDDCKGYIWLLPQEASRLYEEGLPILEINDKLSFLSPFQEDEEINVSRLKPPCPYCKERRCQIRDLRPLNCRLYPLNFVNQNGKVYLVLHLDCQYAREVENNPEFKRRALSLLEQVDSTLLSQVLDTYLSCETLLIFPYGRNRYMILAEL